MNTPVLYHATHRPAMRECDMRERDPVFSFFPCSR